MKKLILAGLLAVWGAAIAAEPVMSVRNGVGGDIILTLRQHEKCGKEGRRAIATEPDRVEADGNPSWIYHYGCWVYFEGVIYAQWDEGQRSQLKADVFAPSEMDLPKEEVPK